MIADQFDWKALPVPPEDMIMRCHGKAVRVSFKDDPAGSLGCSVPAGGYLHLSAGDAGFLKPDTSLGGMVSFETVRWIPLDLSIGSFVDRVIRRLMAGLANANSTGGYALSCAGSLNAYAANTLRWGCLDGQRAVLVEAGATNLLPQQAHDSATLTGGSYSVSSPFPTVREFTAWAGTGPRYAYLASTFSTTNDTTYTISAWVSSSERYVTILGGTTAFGTGKYAVFDLLLGVVVHAVDCEADITSMAGMFRLSITTAAIATTSNGTYGVALSDGTATRIPSITTAGGETLTIFGGQVEKSPCPTSYIPTNGAAVSRAADLVTAPITADVSNGVRVRGTFRMDGVNGPANRVFQADDGGNTNRVELEWHPAERFVAYSIFGGVTQASIDFPLGGDIGDTVDYDLTFTPTEIFGTVNGEYKSAASTGALVTPTIARIGHAAGGSYIPARLLCSKLLVTGV